MSIEILWLAPIKCFDVEAIYVVVSNNRASQTGCYPFHHFLLLPLIILFFIRKNHKIIIFKTIYYNA